MYFTFWVTYQHILLLEEVGYIFRDSITTVQVSLLDLVPKLAEKLKQHAFHRHHKHAMHPFRSSLTFTHCPFLPLFEKNGVAFIKLLQRTVWNQQSVYITIYNNFCTFDNSSDHFLLYFVINNFKKCNFFSLQYPMANNSNFYVLALHLPNCFKKFSKSFSCAPISFTGCLCNS